MKVKDIAEINLENIGKNYEGQLRYLDTSSVTDNYFENYKTYLSFKDAPSRARRKANIGDTVISTVRPNQRHIGFINKQPNNAVYSTGFAVVSPNTRKVDPYYLYLFLSSDKITEMLQQIGETSTSTYPSVKPSDIENLEIELPSKDVQEKISNELYLLDSKIKLNSQINDNLFELAKTLFSEEFSSNDEVLLSNYLLPKRGKNLLKKNVVSGEFPVVAGGLKPAAFHNAYNTKAPVITISASGANAGYVQIWEQPVWSSDSSYIDTSITKDIYFWYLLLKKYQKQIFDAQMGSAQPHIYPKHIGNLLIPNISEDSIKDFNITIAPIFKKIFQNKSENNKLKAIKNSLLIKYFN